MTNHSEFVLSQTDRRPLYLQIMEQVRERVAVGDWLPGQEIPSMRRLAVELQVSVITVKRAYLELERERVIVTRQGKGSCIAPNASLGKQLRQQELKEHLDKAIRLAALLGLTREELQTRVLGTHDQARKDQHDTAGD